MSNREKIIGVLIRSPLTPLAYSDIKATADVPAGSFDRTLAALVSDGKVRKGGDGYRLADDGSAGKTGGNPRGERDSRVLRALRRFAPQAGQGEWGDAGGRPPVVHRALTSRGRGSPPPTPENAKRARENA
jgi:hypothetical protein